MSISSSSSSSDPLESGRPFLPLGALLAGLGVALGAFAAHGLKSHLTPEAMVTFETGVRYQMIHSLALLLVGVLSLRAPHPGPRLSAGLRRSGILFAVGIGVFSGSLYALALTGVKLLGAITPLGGICFLLGWGSLFLSMRRAPPS